MIRILLLVVLFYYILKLALRFLLPQNFSGGNPKQQPKQEGEITILLDEKHKENIRNKEQKGEYVNYKEVE